MPGVGGGETGIRTLGTVARTVVFETTPFDHSGISPRSCRATASQQQRSLIANGRIATPALK